MVIQKTKPTTSMIHGDPKSMPSSYFLVKSTPNIDQFGKLFHPGDTQLKIYNNVQIQLTERNGVNKSKEN